MRGFKSSLTNNNIDNSIIYKDCGFGIKSGKKAINKILSMNKELPSSFFCCNDYIAIGVIEKLKSKGYRIPEDISIIGMDDMELSSEIEPPLTTIRINTEKIGIIGLRKIINLINDNHKEEVKTIIENSLIIRKSCKKIILYQ